MRSASTKLHKSKTKMNISTFYSVSAKVMAASLLNAVGSNLVKMAKSDRNALFTEIIGNNFQVNQQMLRKSFAISTKTNLSYVNKCLSATLITSIISNTALKSQINTIKYIASFFFILIIPKVLSILAPYTGYFSDTGDNRKFLGKVLNVATLVASIATLPSMLSCSLTIGPGAFVFAAFTIMAVGDDATALFKTIIS